MTLRRGVVHGPRPSIERDGQRLVFDFDFALENEGDMIICREQGYTFRSRHKNKKGDFTTELTYRNAVLGPQGAQHEGLDTRKNWVIGVYIPETGPI